MPRVTATEAFAGFRPVAKAFGCIISETNSFGMGMFCSFASCRTIR